MYITVLANTKFAFLSGFSYTSGEQEFLVGRRWGFGVVDAWEGVYGKRWVRVETMPLDQVGEGLSIEGGE